MNLSDYETWVLRRGGPAVDLGLDYSMIALCGEVGELANYYKKVMAGRNPPIRELHLEVGDILYYLTRVAADLGYSLEEAAADNVEKIEARDKKRK